VTSNKAFGKAHLFSRTCARWRPNFTGCRMRGARTAAG
jgi:hypothetical protein